MSKTFLMGEASLSDEERKQMQEVQAEHEVRMKELAEREKKKEEEKKKVTLEELLATTISPLEDRVIVWADPAPEEINGLLVPQEAKAKMQYEQSRGTIIKVGPGKLDPANITNAILLAILKNNVSDEEYNSFEKKLEKINQIDLIPGDRIMYGRNAGTRVQDPATKEELLIMRPGDIFVKL